MNIRPIDLQVMIPKTTEVSKIAQVQDQQGTVQQQQKTEHWQQTLVQRQQQVQTTAQKSRSNSVDMENLEDREKKKGTTPDEQGRKDSHSEEGQASSDSSPVKNQTLGRMIDIKT